MTFFVSGWGRSKPYYWDSWVSSPKCMFWSYRLWFSCLKTAVQEQEGSPQPTVGAFFLEDHFSWQKWCSKPQNRAISRTIPRIFRVVVLVRPQQISPCHLMPRLYQATNELGGFFSHGGDSVQVLCIFILISFAEDLQHKSFSGSVSKYCSKDNHHSD